MLDLRFFRSAPFTGAVIAITAFSALAGFLFLNTLYLQDARGISALHAGLYTLPMATMTVLGAVVQADHRPARAPDPAAGGGRLAAAGALLSGFTATTPAWRCWPMSCSESGTAW